MIPDPSNYFFHYSRLPVANNDYQLPEEFLEYANNLQDVITNQENLKEALLTLKKTINRLLGEKFKGKSSSACVDMFWVEADSGQDWTIKLTLFYQYKHCINPQKKLEAVELFKKYISLEYKDLLENISIGKVKGVGKDVDVDVDGLCIKWKASW